MTNTPRWQHRRTRLAKRDADALFATKKRSGKVPLDFVLDALAEVAVETRPWFGCIAVYVEEKIVFVLRDKPSIPTDNGVWIAMTPEHQAALRRELPAMRAIEVLGGKAAGWQVLRAVDDGFEESVMRACELVVAGDARLGKVPGKKKQNKKSAIGSPKIRR